MEESKYWNYMELDQVSPEELDVLLADGWRHFGTFFFRDMMSWNQGQLSEIIPLRINLAKFKFSKSQRKTIRKNGNTRLVFRDAFIDEEKENLFYKHCVRFTHNVPQSIYDFLSPKPSCVPCHTLECCLFDEDDKLYAVSFMDVGHTSCSSVYAMFDPAYSQKSPGLHTLLAEIIFSMEHKISYLVHRLCF